MRRQNTKAATDVAGAIDDGFDGDKYFGIELSDVRAVRRAAQIGFMSMNIYPPPPGAFWGEFNNRKLHEEWIDDLMKDFIRRIDNCVDESAIDVAVKREWIKNIDDKLETSDGSKIHLLPEITFTELGLKEIEPRNLWMLSGNHRREAVKRFLNQLTEENKVLGDRVKKLESKSKPSDENKKEIESFKEKIGKNDATIAKAKKWTVRLYDRGA
jgi:hypothetical protein